MAGRNCPGEYVLTGHLDAITNAGGPKPFTMTDLIAIAGVVGGLFGGGGGTEMQSALVRLAARARYGPVEGDRVWQGFRGQNDPETVLTLHDGQSFPYGDASPDAPSVVLPDAGSARVEPVVTDATGSATSTATSGSRAGRRAVRADHRPGAPGHVQRRGDLRRALRHRAPDRRLRAADRILLPATADGPGVAGPRHQRPGRRLRRAQPVRAARPGPGLRLERHLRHPGHHRHVRGAALRPRRWHADAGQQPLPVPGPVPGDGGAVPGQPLEPDRRRRHPGRVVQAVAWRTRLGLVGWRGTVGGAPHAFTQLRSTYGREADSALGFQMFNDPAAMGTASAFLDSAQQRRVRLQLVLRQLHRVGVLQLRAQPGTRRRQQPEPADEGRARLRVAGLRPGYRHRPLRPPLGPPALDQPGLLHQLEQQAGQGLRGGRRQLQLRRRTPG